MWAFNLVQKKLDIGSTINGSSLVPGTIVGTQKVEAAHQIVEIKRSSDDSTIPDWKRRMIEKNEKAKQEVNNIMDDSLKRAMAKTEMKPEEQRGQAVDKYVSAVDWVMWSVGTVVNRVK